MGSEVYWDNPRNFWYELRIAINWPGQVRSDEVRWGCRFATILNSIWGILTHHINKVFPFRAHLMLAGVKCAPLRLLESFGDINVKIVFILWNITVFCMLLLASTICASVSCLNAQQNYKTAPPLAMVTWSLVTEDLGDMPNIVLELCHGKTGWSLINSLWQFHLVSALPRLICARTKNKPRNQNTKDNAHTYMYLPWAAFHVSMQLWQAHFMRKD